MKKLFFIPAVLAAGIAMAQPKGGTPDAVKTAFAKAYPSASNVKYEKEDGNYEVSFKQNGKVMSAVYDGKGGYWKQKNPLPLHSYPLP